MLLFIFLFSTKRYNSGKIYFIDDVLPHTAAAANAAAAVALRPGIVSPCYVQCRLIFGWASAYVHSSNCVTIIPKSHL